MPRDDRTDRLLELLRRRGEVTVAELALELEVSERTLFRDLARLRERGIDVEGEPGRGGGVRLSPLAPLPAVHLSDEEAVALVLSLELSRASAGLPFGGAQVRALEKVLAALPPARRRDVRRAAGRVVVGPPAAPGLLEDAGTAPPALLPAFERAFTERCGLAFAYRDRHGARSERRVEPHGLLVQVPLWYVLAWDLDKDAARMFRMDRVSRPRVLPEVTFAPRPPDVIALLAAPAELAQEPAPATPGRSSGR